MRSARRSAPNAPTPTRSSGRPSSPTSRRTWPCRWPSGSAGRPATSPPDSPATSTWPTSPSKAEVSGPGFINFTLRNEWIAGQAAGQLDDPRLGVPAADHAQKVVVDYSGPNVAKEMHVGHLRTTVVGDAMVRILEHLGHEVIRAAHLGDWGTQFGMLIEHLLDVGEEARQSSSRPARSPPSTRRRGPSSTPTRPSRTGRGAGWSRCRAGTRRRCGCGRCSSTTPSSTTTRSTGGSGSP